jgi:threonine aldolase
VISLEEKVANMLKKESALFFPTGTMSNLAAVMSWCTSRGGEMILGKLPDIWIMI